jgi:hypothetical protein
MINTQVGRTADIIARITRLNERNGVISRRPAGPESGRDLTEQGRPTIRRRGDRTAGSRCRSRTACRRGRTGRPRSDIPRRPGHTVCRRAGGSPDRCWAIGSKTIRRRMYSTLRGKRTGRWTRSTGSRRRRRRRRRRSADRSTRGSDSWAPTRAMGARSSRWRCIAPTCCRRCANRRRIHTGMKKASRRASPPRGAWEGSSGKRSCSKRTCRQAVKLPRRSRPRESPSAGRRRPRPGFLAAAVRLDR